jgi:anthranilate/para-aminobenzoate synthase component I
VIRLTATRHAAQAAEADAALAGLGAARGLYFAVEGGIAGLHALQATLVDRPAIELRLFGDGVDVRALNAFGDALLREPELAAWAAGAQRRERGSAIAQVRAFMRCIEPSRDAVVAGALPFAAHRLNAGGGDELLGILFFPERLFRRDAAGVWERVTLSLDGAAAAAAAPEAAASVPAALSEVAVEPHDDLPPGGYAAMVRRAVTLLQERPLVSLTLSQAYRRRVDAAPIEAFRRLREANPAPATFFFNDGAGECLFGASPDLQLVIEGGVVQALPVCGTVARGAGAVGEAQSLRELIDEEVDAASLAVCTDALRNDLAPLCEPGSLELLDRRRPMSLATVIHAVDRLRGRLRDGCDA